MDKILENLQFPKHPKLIVGIDTRDDAGIYKINDSQALIQTLDFLTPMVDDPFVFGQIAATNALNDVYAMGGHPLLAMNIVCYPECADMQVLRRIIEGGLSKVVEAGALLVGGHTVDDIEPKFGLSVSGIVHPSYIIRNRGAEPGDVIFLTKPLGNGVISTAIKAGLVDNKIYNEAIKWMTQLNNTLPDIAREFDIHAATDVTGFGLIGHLLEMSKASDVQIELNTSRIPYISGALDYVKLGLVPSGAYKTRDHIQDMVRVHSSIDVNRYDLLFSPETAGGLLIAVAPNSKGEFASRLEKSDALCAPVARVLKRGFKPLVIR